MRAAAVALLVVLGLGPAAAAMPQSTRVTVYRPFAKGKLAAGFSVARTAKGYCFSGSAADPRRDAWRCFIGNAIHDPCFSAGRPWVACPADGTPFVKRLVRIDLTKPLPSALANRGAAGEGNPWAVKLAGGEVCTFLTGATFVFHRKRVNYGCFDQRFLAGSPDRSTATWTITLGVGSRSKARKASILVAAW